ncbi:MAG TPA: hypothetical protein VHO07_11630, partial [Streptosporangiaceae bacterium]|nr:hypothetical protein [Streptosporangiaceae bacterium]
LTVTDEHGHATGHGCARPEPKNHIRPDARNGKPRPPTGPAAPGGHDPPGTGAPPGFTFTATGDHGPPKQHPRWKVGQISPGTFRRIAPSGRQYTTEPTRYPV